MKDLNETINTLREMEQELRRLRVLDEWVRKGLNVAEGDRVVISIAPQIRKDSGWWAYRECLTEGATGVVTNVRFNEYWGYWQAGVVLDREWSTSSEFFSGEMKRWWHGPVEETPPGYEPPSRYEQEHYGSEGRKGIFYINIESLKTVKDEVEL